MTNNNELQQVVVALKDLRDMTNVWQFTNELYDMDIGEELIAILKDYEESAEKAYDILTRANNTPDDGALETFNELCEVYLIKDNSRLAETIRQALSKTSVDVEGLRKSTNIGSRVGGGYYDQENSENRGWNDCLEYLHQQGHITDKPVVNEKLTTEKPETITCTCGVIFTSKTKMINLDATIDKLDEVLSSK